ncbi:MAG: glycoside hydrolase family 127 protein, partial [Phycisphaerales bacterium]|nr:glycoside hydrolase family 127 protein [Phycisphaerales bacterium]
MAIGRWSRLVISTGSLAMGAAALDGAHVDESARWRVAESVRVRTEPFPHASVRITGGPWKVEQDRAASYLLEVDADRLLCRFREEAGLEPRGEVYGGWESDSISGHSLGHYLSGVSLAYAATGDERFRERAAYVVDQIIECQDASGDGFASGVPNGKAIFDAVRRGEIRSSGFDLNGSWVPWYTQHKIMAGLRDALLYTGNEAARDSLIAMADWVCGVVEPLQDEQIQRMLACEHGGMNEVMADVFDLTGNERYLKVATRHFDHGAVLDPLRRQEDPLRGLHANTQIPKIIGQARIHEVTGDPEASRLARHFWALVTDRYTYANGGNSTWEMFGPPNVEAGALPETTETCNTSNMLRLTDHLFRWSGDARYADYAERALTNHILAQQHPDGGRYMYRAWLDQGAHKTWSGREDTWTCCHGTGMENHVRYNEMVYFRGVGEEAPTLYVNLFLPSTLSWTDMGLELAQESELPLGGTSAL